jgi:hypothetical protein
MLPFLLHLSFNNSEQKDVSALLASLNNSHLGVHNQKQTPFLSICITLDHFINQISILRIASIWIFYLPCRLVTLRLFAIKMELNSL